MVAYWIDVERNAVLGAVRFRGNVGARLGPERTTGPCTGLLFGVVGVGVGVVSGQSPSARAGFAGVSGGGLWVGLSSGQWTRASFFPGRRDMIWLALREGSGRGVLWLIIVCLVTVLIADGRTRVLYSAVCVVVVGVLVKLSRAHGGCLGIRSR